MQQQSLEACLARGRSFEHHELRTDAVRRVTLQRFKVQLPLVAEGVVQALPSDVHRLEQRLGGRAFEPVLREDGDGARERDVANEILRSGHPQTLNYLE